VINFNPFDPARFLCLSQPSTHMSINTFCILSGWCWCCYFSDK